MSSSSGAQTRAAKRAASSLSAHAAEPPETRAKKAKADQTKDEFDEFANDDDDADALIAAAEEAESLASSPVQPRASQTSAVTSGKIATPASSAKVASASTTPTKTSTTAALAKAPTLSQNFLTAKPPGASTASNVPKVQPPADPASDPLWLERQTMSPDWFQRLESEMKQPYFIELKRFLASEDRAGKRTYPPPPLVHSWSRLTPIDRVKVVVVGQDPYHGPNQACGLSFSVNRGVATPPSLRNIYKEIATEYPGFKPPNHGCLDGWATQGVLLLNACLTVSAGQAGSHHGKGWEKLTKHILKLVADHHHATRHSNTTSAPVANSKIATMFAKVSAKQKTGVDAQNQKASSSQNGGGGGGDDNDNDGDGDGDGKGKGKDKGKGVVFLVWGAPAAKTLAEAGVTDTSGNVLILKSPHPSPLSAHRGFLGNGHFVKANTWLQQRYGPDGGIDWTKL